MRQRPKASNLQDKVKEARGPHFKDFRRTVDGVMVADLGFKKQLWALDSELDVVWDYVANKWEIWKFPGQGKKVEKRVDHRSFHVMTVQTKGRTFRELGADILLKLQQGDPHRYSLKDFVKYFDQIDSNVRRAKESAFKNKMDAMHAETFWYHRGLRKTVPQSYNIKPSEEKLLLKVSSTEAPVQIFKPTNMQKVANVVTGGAV